MQMTLSRNVSLINMYSFITGLVFSYPILIFFYKDQMGLTISEFFICQVLFCFSLTALEVPCGYLSDVWKRKLILFLSGLSYLIGCWMIVIYPNFYAALISQIFIALSHSLQSGTVSALLFDSIENKENRLYRKNETVRYSLSLFALAFASMVGGVMYERNVNLPLILTGLVGAAQMLISISLIEPKKVECLKRQNIFIEVINVTKKLVANDRSLWYAIISTSILFCILSNIVWLIQIYIDKYGAVYLSAAEIITIGLILAGVLARLGSINKIRNLLYSLQIKILALITSILLSASALVSPPYGAIILTLCFGLMGYVFPLARSYVNENLKLAERATILSLFGFSSRLCFIIFAILFSIVQKKFSYEITLGIIAILTTLTVWPLVSMMDIKKEKQV